MISSVKPTRSGLSVSGRIQRTSNGVKSFHNICRQLVLQLNMKYFQIFSLL